MVPSRDPVLGYLDPLGSESSPYTRAKAFISSTDLCLEQSLAFYDSQGPFKYSRVRGQGSFKGYYRVPTGSPKSRGIVGFYSRVPFKGYYSVP